MTRTAIAWIVAVVAFTVLFFIWREVAQQVLPRRPVPLRFFLNMALLFLLVIWLTHTLSFWISIPISALLLPFFVLTKLDHLAQDIAAVAEDYLEPLVISLLSGAWVPVLIASVLHKWILARPTDTAMKH